jgi:hypothetical protein
MLAPLSDKAVRTIEITAFLDGHYKGLDFSAVSPYGGRQRGFY